MLQKDPYQALECMKLKKIQHLIKTSTVLSRTVEGVREVLSIRVSRNLTSPQNPRLMNPDIALKKVRPLVGNPSQAHIVRAMLFLKRNPTKTPAETTKFSKRECLTHI